MEGGGWSSFAAPLPNAHTSLAGPLLLRRLHTLTIRPSQVALRHRVSIMSLANEVKKKGTMFFEVILPNSDSIVSEVGII